MQTLSTALERATQPKRGLPPGTPSPPDTAERPSLRSKQQLSEILGRVCALQKTYGKTKAELETLIDGFSWALAGTDMGHVRQAFRRYVVAHSDIPAPSDILKLVAEIRRDAEIETPSVERLRLYQASGIGLTPRQRDVLREHEADAAAAPIALPSAERITP